MRGQDHEQGHERGKAELGLKCARVEEKRSVKNQIEAERTKMFTVNGNKVKIEEHLTISGYLASAGIDPSLVVVEYNHQIPDRQEWPNIHIQNGDNLEIVKFIGGG